MSHDQLARWLRYSALTLLCLFVAFGVFMGVGEMIGGDGSGAGHLIPAAIVSGLAFLAWKRPIVGGIVLAILGLSALAYIGLNALVFASGPLLLAGLLFIVAAQLTQSGPISRPR